MEKFTLTPKQSEIVVNNGSAEGAVDLFSYGADMEPAARTLGSLYVVGWRQADTNTMGYMVSLIAALARREYYAQPNAAPRDAFTRALHRINEVVDEFYKSSGVQLAVGIFAVAGGGIMVSKLDKFKILLARDGEVVDILNNVALFSKEHLEKRQFSSIISGSVQAGDRLLAYYPAKQITSRERSIKAWFLAEQDVSGLAARLATLGSEHPEFSASFMHVGVVQTAVAAVDEPTLPAPQQNDPQQAPEQTAPPASTPALAWAPRQAGSPAPATLTSSPRPAPAVAHPSEDPEQEVPHIIPSEYTFASRTSPMSRWFGRFQIVRLNVRGKAIVLTLLAVLIAGSTLAARSLWLISPEAKQAEALLGDVKATLQMAQSKAAGTEQGEARTILTTALATLAGSAELADNEAAHELAAAITATLDTLDNATAGTPSAIAQLDPATDRIELAAWSSSSHSLWAVTAASDGSTSAIELRDGIVVGRTALPSDAHPSLLIAWNNGALGVDTAARAIFRIANGAVRRYDVPIQEELLDATVFDGTVYMLTDKAILKISDLDTDKPVTKRWLVADSDLVPGGARIRVDGNIYTLGRDGVLATYYKGKKKATAQTPLSPSGNWKIGGTTDETELAVSTADRMRVYVVSLKDGALLRTIKLESQQSLVLMTEGPDGSTIFVSKDNRIWKLQ